MANEKNSSGAKIGLIAVCVCILFVLISSSLFFFLNRQGNKSSNLNGRTITPTADATMSLVPTPSPLFFDDFTGTSKGWYLGSVSGYSRVINDSELTLADVNHTILTESLPTNATFSDFAITVTFTIQEAASDDSVGLYLRGDSYLDHDYRVDFFGNTSYAVSKEYLDASKSPEVQILVNPTNTTLLHPVGQRNTITVVMKGPKIVLLIGGKVVNTITDTAYTNGQIALFVQNSATSREVKASFSNIVVYPAPGHLP